MRSGRLRARKYRLSMRVPCDSSVHAPRRRQDVDAVETLGAVHLGQKLVDDAVRHARAVMSSAPAHVSTPQSEGGGRGATHRFGAIESNSSKKRTQGLAAWARSKRSRTDFSLAPIYLLRSSGPLTEIKLRPHSLATAEARRVLPQPGKP